MAAVSAALTVSEYVPTAALADDATVTVKSLACPAASDTTAGDVEVVHPLGTLVPSENDAGAQRDESRLVTVPVNVTTLPVVPFGNEAGTAIDGRAAMHMGVS